MDDGALRRGAAILALAVTSPASAHPVDEVIQSAYLAIAPDAVRLEFDISPGPVAARTVLVTLDADGDRRITPAEAGRYARRVLARLRLTIDGRPVAWRFDQIGVPAYVNIEQQADTIRIFATAAYTERGGRHRVTLRNDYRPATSVVMTNIFPRSDARWTYAVEAQQRSADGRSYVAKMTARSGRSIGKLRPDRRLWGHQPA